MSFSRFRLIRFGKNRFASVSSRRFLSYSLISVSVFSLLSLLLIPEFLPGSSFADEPITVNPSITIGGSGSLDLAINPGQFGSVSEDVTVTTTNYTGYTMTIAPSSGVSTDLENIALSNVVIPSIQEELTAQEFTNLSSTAYGLSIDDGANYIPVTSNTTIKSTNSATNATTGQFSLTLGAKAEPTAPAGTYTKTFTLTATTNAPVYAITYNANVDGQGGSGTAGEVTNLPSPNPQITGASGLNLILSSSVPIRAGYLFLGWDTNSSATTATYQPGDTLTLDPEINNTPTLYAIWIQSLQSWDRCNSLSVGDIINLYDDRDNQIYEVRKLKMNSDGSKATCWMSNLNLGATPLATGTTLTSNNTHIPSGTTIAATTFNSWIKSSGTSSYTSPELIPVTTSNSENGVDTDDYGNKYGTLYNFSAATAGTYTYAESQGIGNAQYDLCPAGWRLPTGDSGGELEKLTSDGYSVDSMWATDGPTITEFVLGFSRAGSFISGAIDAQGDYGYYWASTFYSSKKMYSLEYNLANGLYSDDGESRNQGFAVRCIKQSSSHTLTISTGTGVDSVIIDGISYYDGDTIDFEEGFNHTINMALDSGYRFDSWSVSGTGTSIASTSTQSTTLTMGTANSTLTASAQALVAYSLVYNANGGTGAPATQTQYTETQVSNVVFALSSTIPTRSGYGFWGWGTASTDTNPTYDNSLKPVETNQTVTTLYAIWKQTSGTIQNWSGCSSMSVGSTIYLLDNRDNQAYKVSKFYMDSNHTAANAKCWMSNLNLGAWDVTSNLTSSNTHLSSTVTATDFKNWNRTVSGETDSYTNPKFSPASITTSVNPYDSYGNKYGVLYNYAATSGGTYAYAQNAGTGNAESDLCPAGWRLPTGGSGGEFEKLTIDGYNLGNNGVWNSGGYTNIESVLGFSQAGYFQGGAPGAQLGTRAFYWSSTRYAARSMHTLAYRDILLDQTFYTNRDLGRSVRCIIQTPPHTLTISTGTGVNSVTIDGITYHNGDTVNLEEHTPHTIGMTLATGYEFDSWAVSGTGTSIASTSTQSTTLTMGTANSTLTANSKVAKQYLQSWDGCSSMSVGDTITLFDIRDEQAYTVRKLYMDSNHTAANAKCWMSNLNLGAEPLLVSQLDNTNSNMPTASAISKSTFESWAMSSPAVSFTNPGFITLTASNSSDGATVDSYGNKYGTLYNYAATSANTINATTNNNNASNSICPKGWRLPTGGNAGEFTELIVGNGGIRTEMNSSTTPTGAQMETILQRDLGFPFAGAFADYLDGQGEFSINWSSTAYDETNMYNLPFGWSYVWSVDKDSREFGASLHCIKDSHNLTVSLGTGVASITVDGITYNSDTTISLGANTTHSINMTFQSGYNFYGWALTSVDASLGSTSSQSTNITMGYSNATITAIAKQTSVNYMQNWQGCSSLSTNGTTNLIDMRDGTQYTVAKLADGKCWMTQNMRLNPSSSAITSKSVAELEATTNNPSSGFWNIAKGQTAYFDADVFDDINYSTMNIGGTNCNQIGGKCDAYGIYYNWYTATAGHGIEDKLSGNTMGDICPAGWTLPTGGTGSNTDFKLLNTAINSGSTTSPAGLVAPPANFAYSGDSSDGINATFLGEGAAYWSKTAESSDAAYMLYYRNNRYVYPGTEFMDKTSGMAIRCRVGS